MASGGAENGCAAPLAWLDPPGRLCSRTRQEDMMQRPELAPRAASDGTRGKRDPTRDTDDVTMRTSPLQELGGLGQSVWIDYLSRDLLERGGLARLIEEDAVVGVTSNPTIFQGPLRRLGLRRAAHGAARRRGRPEGALLRAGGSRRRGRVRFPPSDLGGDGRTRRLRLLGGRPEPCRRPEVELAEAKRFHE